MKLVANIQLKPNRQQAQALRETLERCNAACNWISEQAFATQTLKQFALHKLVYKTVRERFDLAAQVAVRGETSSAHNSLAALVAELDADRDFQEARRLF